ncbi:hypothetical protein V6N12_009823 [Hibiscus sabdariffa]|uniref:Uncharacterized protein n=1 Tax=Hibiscus sabdariffa TaxID=183260 RepID=A0ABR2ECB4_9ROSI
MARLWGRICRREATTHQINEDLNFNGESGVEPYIPSAQSSGGRLHLMGSILQISGGILELDFWIFMLLMIQSFSLRLVMIKEHGFNANFFLLILTYCSMVVDILSGVMVAFQIKQSQSDNALLDDNDSVQSEPKGNGHIEDVQKESQLMKIRKLREI